MKYFSIARNPFSAKMQYQMQKLVDKNSLSNEIILHLLPIEHIQDDINEELEIYNLKIDHVLLFYRPAGVEIESHIDFFEDNTVCNSSLVIPWICKDGYSVFWEQGNFNLIKETPAGYKDVEYFKIDWKSEHKICFETQITTPIVLKTDIPHGVHSPKNKILLATIRFKNNPSFDELCKKFAVE